MPIYDYKCTECSTLFEKNVSVERRAEKQRCPSCGKDSGAKQFVKQFSVMNPTHPRTRAAASNAWDKA